MAALSAFSPPLHQIKTTLSPIILAIGIAIAGIIDLQRPPLENSYNNARLIQPAASQIDSQQEP